MTDQQNDTHNTDAPADDLYLWRVEVAGIVGYAWADCPVCALQRVGMSLAALGVKLGPAVAAVSRVPLRGVAEMAERALAGVPDGATRH